MLLNGGELNGKRILSRKTVELMTMNHLPDNKTLLDMNAGGGFSEVRYQGMGYGLSMAVTVDQAATQISGTAGSYNWGGMASTFFWIDPKENFLRCKYASLKNMYLSPLTKLSSSSNTVV